MSDNVDWEKVKAILHRNDLPKWVLPLLQQFYEKGLSDGRGRKD